MAYCTGAISKALAEAGYTVRWDWYNLHGSVRDGEYRVELFPVPVITVGHWCEVILKLDCVCVEDYTEDLYRPGMDLEGLSARLERYGRCHSLTLDCQDEVIVEIADYCRKWDTHVE